MTVKELAVRFAKLAETHPNANVRASAALPDGLPWRGGSTIMGDVVDVTAYSGLVVIDAKG